jgi:hypothetical protein
VNELGREFGGALNAAVRPAINDFDGATFDPTEFAQPLREGRCIPARLCVVGQANKANCR